MLGTKKRLIKTAEAVTIHGQVKTVKQNQMTRTTRANDEIHRAHPVRKIKSKPTNKTYCLLVLSAMRFSLLALVVGHLVLLVRGLLLPLLLYWSFSFPISSRFTLAFPSSFVYSTYE